MIDANFDLDARRVSIAFAGRVDAAAVIAWLPEFIERIDGTRDLRGIVDTRKISELHVEAADLHAMAKVVAAAKDANLGARWAVIADQDLVFGMARVYQALSSEANFAISVFRDPLAAEAWLED